MCFKKFRERKLERQTKQAKELVEAFLHPQRDLAFSEWTKSGSQPTESIPERTKSGLQPAKSVSEPISSADIVYDDRDPKDVAALNQDAEALNHTDTRIESARIRSEENRAKISATTEAMKTLISGNAKKAKEMIYNAKNPGFVPEMLRLIDEQHRRDTAVYKAAHIDRRLFSKMISNREYKPARDTCISLILALHLPQEKAEFLFQTAGYAFSLSDGRDLVILYCIHKKIWDIDNVNEILENLAYRPIGSQKHN